MEIINLSIAPRTQPHLESSQAQDRWRSLAHDRLNEVFSAAEVVPFDDDSRLVLFSDCHRGNNSRADAFAANEELFLYALRQYERRGFTYIEVGDGDELWQNRRFETVRRAHARTHGLLHRLAGHGRLHLVLGNHDIQKSGQGQVDKDGLLAREGLVLQHARTKQQIFVVHGHQADRGSDQLAAWSRLTVRLIWRQMLLLRLANGILWAAGTSHRSRLEQRIMVGVQRHKYKIERRIVEWARERHQPVICGHTHRPFAARPGMPPYFNTGNCVTPGQITGLEIEQGHIAQVRWAIQNGHVQLEQLSTPRPLRLFA